jgi:hypothetical protein
LTQERLHVLSLSLVAALLDVLLGEGAALAACEGEAGR